MTSIMVPEHWAPLSQEADLTEYRSGFLTGRDGTRAALVAHGVTIEPDGFRYAGGLKRKVDCNAVYKLLDEGLWWSLLAGMRLAIVSGHAETLAARLMDAEFLRATGGGEK